jgi:hypothetical protein
MSLLPHPHSSSVGSIPCGGVWNHILYANVAVVLVIASPALRFGRDTSHPMAVPKINCKVAAGHFQPRSFSGVMRMGAV